MFANQQCFFSFFCLFLSLLHRTGLHRQFCLSGELTSDVVTTWFKKKIKISIFLTTYHSFYYWFVEVLLPFYFSYLECTVITYNVLLLLAFFMHSLIVPVSVQEICNICYRNCISTASRFLICFFTLHDSLPYSRTGPM